MVLRAVDEGRAVHSPAARTEEDELAEDELAEEWSPEELSSAALLASSVLAKHGTGQVCCRSAHVSWPATCVWTASLYPMPGLDVNL